MVALALVVAGASLSNAQTKKNAKPRKKTTAKTVVKAEPAPQETKPAFRLTSGIDSLSYAAGYAVAEMVRDRLFGGLANELKGTSDSLNYSVAYQGLFDALKRDTTLMKPQSAEWFLNNRMMSHQRARAEKEMAAGKAFLAENAKKEGVVTLPSGLQYKVLTQGDGPVPKADDQVKVKYEGRLIDGTVFDSTDKHGGQPATFAPNLVIRGWTEALTMMPVGSKWQLYIPQELGYGGRAAGMIPAYSTLIFDIEVVGIEGDKSTPVKSKKKK